MRSLLLDSAVEVRVKALAIDDLGIDLSMGESIESQAKQGRPQWSVMVIRLKRQSDLARGA